jgi:hypothetical protein
MDIADESFNEEQSYITEKIHKVKRKSYTKLSPVGYCHNCFEDLDDNKLFCNDKCATQYNIAEKFNFK